MLPSSGGGASDSNSGGDDYYPDMSRYATEFVTDPLPSPVRHPLLGGFSEPAGYSDSHARQDELPAYPDMSRYNTTALIPPTPAPARDARPSRPRRNTQFQRPSPAEAPAYEPETHQNSRAEGGPPRRPRRKSAHPSTMGEKKLSMTGNQLLKMAYESSTTSNYPTSETSMPRVTTTALPENLVDKTLPTDLDNIFRLVEDFHNDMERCCASFASVFNASQEFLQKAGNARLTNRDKARAAFLRSHMVDGISEIAGFWAKTLSPDALKKSDVQEAISATANLKRRGKDRVAEFHRDESDHLQWLESERLRLQKEEDLNRKQQLYEKRLLEEKEALERAHAAAERERQRREAEERSVLEEKERQIKQEMEREKQERELAAAREIENQKAELQRIREETERLRQVAEKEAQATKEIEEQRRLEAQMLAERREEAEAERVRIEAENERKRLEAELERAREMQREEQRLREKEHADHERKMAEIREQTSREAMRLAREQEMLENEVSSTRRSRRVEKKRFVPETPIGEPSPTPKGVPMMRHPTPTNPGDRPVVQLSSHQSSNMPGTRKRPIPPRRRAREPHPRSDLDHDATIKTSAYTAKTPARSERHVPPRKARGASTANLIKKHQETPRTSNEELKRKPPSLSIGSPASSVPPRSSSSSRADSKPAPRPRMNSSRRSKQAVALYDFVPENDDELSFSEGEKLLIIKELKAGWSEGLVLSTGQRGICPTSYVKIL